MEFLKNWILNLAVTAIFIVFIEILMPSGKTKKLVNLISGFILIITIIQPFLNILLKGNNLNWFNIWDGITYEISDMDISREKSKEEQINQIIKVYERRIKGEIEEIARGVEGVKDAEIDMIFNDDYDSPNFGEIKRVYVYLISGYTSHRNGEGNNIEYEDSSEGEINGDNNLKIMPIERVKEIDIDLRNKETKYESELSEKYKTDIISNLEERLASSFFLKKEDLVISFK